MKSATDVCTLLIGNLPGTGIYVCLMTVRAPDHTLI